MSLGEVFRCFGPEYVASRPGKIPTAHFKVMRAITLCRTPVYTGKTSSTLALKKFENSGRCWKTQLS